MLKQQDELLRLSIGQRPNQQPIHQTEHGCGRADCERNGNNSNGCKRRLLQQLAKSESKIFKHSQSKALRLGIR